MSDVRWRRLEEIVQAALERSPGERLAFVREASAGDEALQREVESLLANASSADKSTLRIGNLGLDLVGRQIGVYRVDAVLGAGGMGEVYRARDMKLGRDVAIKVLPAAFMIDPERRARFEREARLLATLAHPNIGAIYGLEASDGVRALVLELIDGDTLSDRIVREPLSLTDVLRIAREVADALDAAHEKGIVHRDLKPANIKLTRQGSVKVLDFGLAKATADDGHMPELTDSPTVTIGATRSGLLLGTAAYMSPEQARGKPVDRRADIWAFGCVLYEMLARRSAFGAETVSDTLVAVLDRDPDWGALPSSTPTSVRRLLRRCLEKDPARRLRDIGDARSELDDRTETVSAGSAPAGQGFHVRPRALLAVGIGVLGVATIMSWLATRTPRDAPRPVIRATLNLGVNEELDTQPTSRPLALSPDGRRLAYVARRDGDYQLYVRDLDAFDAKAMPGTEGARYPFFSPDGESIAFFAEGKLKRVSILGGSPAVICDVSPRTKGGAWSQGVIVFFDPGRPALMKVPASGGSPEPVTIKNAEVANRILSWPDFLPDGRRLLVSVSLDPTGAGTEALAILSVESGEWTPLGNGSQAQYIGSGYVVFHASHVREGELQAIELDLSTWRARGDPMSVLDDVFRSESSGGAYFAAAAGTLIFARGGHSRSLVRVDRTGRRTSITNDRRGFRFPRFSPDGSQIAVTIDPRPSQIWIYDVGRGRGFPLTTEGHHIVPTWSPDGKRVAYSSRGNIVARVADGSAPEEVLVGLSGGYPASWAKDGRLVFNQNDSQNRADIWIKESGAPPHPLFATPAHEPHPALSPDERWIAYPSDETRRMEVHVRPFPHVNDGKWIVSTQGGTTPVWSPNGRELFYMSGQALMSAAVEATGKTFRVVGTPQQLFTGPFETGSPNFDISPDGTHFVMVEADPEAKPTQLHAIYNFSEELRGRARVSSGASR